MLEHLSGPVPGLTAPRWQTATVPRDDPEPATAQSAAYRSG